jgi:formylglycine-generating enzyme
MRKQFLLTVALTVSALTAMVVGANSSPEHQLDDLVFVKGGSFNNTNSNYYGKGVTISDFYIGRNEVTQKEWTEVTGGNPSQIKGDDLPVEMVSWYDAVEYSNKRSTREGLTPYYIIDKNQKDPNNKPDPKFGALDDVLWTVTIKPEANGYRLPTEAEWEYAASGGQLSRNYIYSGSDDIDDVAWYWRNSGDKELNGFWQWPAIQGNHDRSKPVGSKRPNELGLFDMSGNVREWCWDWYGDLQTNVIDPTGSPSGSTRVWRGGGWMGAAFSAESTFRASLAANGKGPDQGFRVCRRK